MSDENQLTVPQSFIDVFIEPGRVKPSMPKEHIAVRYEFCEDLAVALTDRARTILWDTKVTEPLVLDRIRTGLREEGSGVEPREADWITKRLSELLEWRLHG